MMSRLFVVLACVISGALQAAPGFHTISGRVRDAAGGVPQQSTLSAWVASGPRGSSGTPIQLAPDGSFTSPPLADGIYALTAGQLPHPPGQTKEDLASGLAVVQIRGADVLGIEIKMRRYSLRGRYVMRSDNPQAPWPSSLNVSAMLVEPAGVPLVSESGEGAPNGEFVLRNVFGKRVLRVGYSLASGARWWPDAVLLNGADITDIPTDFSEHTTGTLEVTFTQHPARVTGTIMTADGAPAPAATVVALAEEPRLWNHWSSYTQVVQASPAGGFSLATRPGRLRLVALPRESFDTAFHREIDFDKLAPVGQPVTVGARATVRAAPQLRSPADQEPLTPVKASR